MSVRCLLGSPITFYFVLHDQLPLLECIFFLHVRAGFSDWDAASPARYVVAIDAIEVPEGLEPLVSGGYKALKVYTGGSRRDTRGTSSSGQADNAETWEETKEKSADCTSPTLQAAKDFKKQERKFKPNQQK